MLKKAEIPRMPRTTVTYLFDPTNNWIKEILDKIGLLKSTDSFEIQVSESPENVKDQEIVFILSYTHILNRAFLQSNRLNLVVHASALPRGRGFAPLQWQILEGAKSIPVTLIEAIEEVDAGDILGEDEINLEGHELYEEIRNLQGHAVGRLLSEFLAAYPNFERRPQVGTPSYYPRRTPNDSALDLSRTLEEQFNLLRICNNDGWPAFFVHHGRRYVLKIEKS